MTHILHKPNIPSDKMYTRMWSIKKGRKAVGISHQMNQITNNVSFCVFVFYRLFFVISKFMIKKHIYCRFKLAYQSP